MPKIETFKHRIGQITFPVAPSLLHVDLPPKGFPSRPTLHPLHGLYPWGIPREKTLGGHLVFVLQRLKKGPIDFAQFPMHLLA
jgi:hypothetical protein